jgi:hypothetical protein
MGKIRRHGFVLEWFIGDHAPRHVHVYNTKGHFLGRFDLKRRVGHEGWQPSKKLLKLINELENEGRL